MTTLQVRRATVRSRLSIVEIDDNGNRTRYIAESVVEDYAQKLAAAPELLEALKWCKDALESLGYTVSKNTLDAIAKAEVTP
jgi:hypothetical protein